MVKLRKDNLVLVYGKYTLLDKSNPGVYAFTREFEGRKMLILLNFSAFNKQAHIRVNITNAKMLLSNYNNAPVNNKIKSNITLRPYEAIIYKL